MVKTYFNIDNLSTRKQENTSLKFGIAVLLCVALLILYFLVLRRFLNLYIFIPLFIFIALRIFMIIPGEEKLRMKEYKEMFKSPYMTVDKISKISSLSDSNIIFNDRRFYKYIYMEPNFYLRKEDFNRDFVELLTYFAKYNIYLKVYNDKNEYSYGDVTKLGKYKNLKVLQQRLQLISEANKYIEDTNKLYVYLLVIETFNKSINDLEALLKTVSKSDCIRCMSLFKVLNTPNDICEALSRDGGYRINLDDIIGSSDINDEALKDVITYRR